MEEGRRISHFRIVERLGGGGMGVVYKAHDERLSRLVALKFLPLSLADSPAYRARLEREASAASNLDHPNICTIHEIDETEDGQLFIAMAFYEGETLKRKIARDLLSLESSLNIALQAAEGLAAAHRQGILHRDIKPANLMITREGTVKIVDFGLARKEDQTRITVEGTVVGTPGYMSPEQMEGKDSDRRSDVWALGVVIYQMLSGDLPFSDNDLNHGITLIPITDRIPNVPEDLQEILSTALSRDPDDRHQDAIELAAALRRVREELGFASSSTMMTETWLPPDSQGSKERGLGGYRRGLQAIGLLVGLVAAVVLVSLVLRRETTVPPIEIQPTQLTGASAAWQGEPSISPDGSRIAFASDESGNLEIFVVGTKGGRPLQLTRHESSDRHPAWYPDGAYLAFTSNRSGENAIWKVGQYGDDPQFLVSRAEQPAISPDGTRIAFSRPGENEDLRIFLAPLNDSTAAVPLTSDGDGLWLHESPTWSPDSRWICYAAADGLWVVLAGGGKPARLTLDRQPDIEPEWSPTGEVIYFSSHREGTRALWWVESSGGEPTRLTIGTGGEGHPSVSQDGSLMTYSTHEIRNDLVFRNMATGLETVLEHNRDDGQPSLASDGSMVVFASSRAGVQNLWEQAFKDSELIGQPRIISDQLTGAAHPALSPDGRWVAFYRFGENQRDIWVVPTAGGEPLQLTSHQAADIHPDWSPDGKTLAFATERTGTSAIWTVQVEDGGPISAPVPLTQGDLLAYGPAWDELGEKLAFIGIQDGQSEVWIVGIDTLTPPKRVTSGADAHRVRWKEGSAKLLVSGTWGLDRLSLRQIDPNSGRSEPLIADLDLGPPDLEYGFDMSTDGSMLVYSRGDLKGNVWTLRAVDGGF